MLVRGRRPTSGLDSDLRVSAALCKAAADHWSGSLTHTTAGGTSCAWAVPNRQAVPASVAELWLLGARMR